MSARQLSQFNPTLIDIFEAARELCFISWFAAFHVETKGRKLRHFLPLFLDQLTTFRIPKFTLKNYAAKKGLADLQLIRQDFFTD